jgi:hypothetical protein
MTDSWSVTKELSTGTSVEMVAFVLQNEDTTRRPKVVRQEGEREGGRERERKIGYCETTLNHIHFIPIHQKNQQFKRSIS